MSYCADCPWSGHTDDACPRCGGDVIPSTPQAFSDETAAEVEALRIAATRALVLGCLEGRW